MAVPPLTPPVQPEDALQYAVNIYTLLSAAGGAILGALTMTFKGGKAVGKLTQRIAEMEEQIAKGEENFAKFQESVKANVGQLSENHDKIREKLSDIRAVMVQRADLQQLASSMSAAMDGLRTRMDALLSHR